jgi:hypothetical protein
MNESKFAIFDAAQSKFDVRDNGQFELDASALIHFIRENVVYDTGRIFMSFCRRFPQAIDIGFGNKRALFIEGTREDRCIMVAHADTAWSFGSMSYIPFDALAYTAIEFHKDKIRSRSSRFGIGADDRAGIAMIWQLASLGHSILITDGEEAGGLGARYVAERWPEWNAIQDRHSFCIEFDRMGVADFKTYEVGTPEFDSYVSKAIGRPMAPPKSFSDISFLCTRIPGANIGVGYYNEHTPDEYINVSEWCATLDTARNWLTQPLSSFKLGV